MLYCTVLYRYSEGRWSSLASSLLRADFAVWENRRGWLVMGGYRHSDVTDVSLIDLDLADQGKESE